MTKWSTTFGKTLQNDRFQRGVFFGLLIGISALLIRNTVGQGQDFSVFWRTGVLIDSFTGNPGERVYHPLRDGAHTYKYPPWTGILWMPFGLMSLALGKWVWGILQSLCLVFVASALRQMGFGFSAINGALLAWLGIWIVHGLDGQIALPMLAVALWAYQRPGFVGFFVMAYALSMKGTTLVGALPRLLEVRRRPGWIALGVLAVIALTGPVFWAEQTVSFFELLRRWADAARSGETWKYMLAVLGRPNQGLPMFFRRVWPELSNEWVSVALIAFGVPLWWHASRRLRAEERWFGYLAMSVVTHPLAWFHSFVLAFPLGVAALSRWPSLDHVWRVVLVLGVVGVGSITEKTAGFFGRNIEWASGKSWAVVMLMAVIAFAPSTKRKSHRARV